jgi:predicted secreted protein
MKNNQNNNKSPIDIGAINNASSEINQNRIMLSLAGLIIIAALICLAYFYLKYSQISEENRYYYEDF